MHNIKIPSSFNLPPSAMQEAGGIESKVKQGLQEAGGHHHQVSDGVGRPQWPGKETDHAIREHQHHQPKHHPLCYGWPRQLHTSMFCLCVYTCKWFAFCPTGTLYTPPPPFQIKHIKKPIICTGMKNASIKNRRQITDWCLWQWAQSPLPPPCAK